MRSLCNYSHSRVLRYLVVILISVSRMTNDVPYLPVIICFCIYLLRPFAWFIVGLFIFLSFEDSVYVLDTGLLSYLSFANIFSCVLFFHSLDSVWTKRKCRCGWRVDQVSQCGREANRQQLAGAERWGTVRESRRGRGRAGPAGRQRMSRAAHRGRARRRPPLPRRLPGPVGKGARRPKPLQLNCDTVQPPTL